jgi:digeranylgeranylglycerophospholipid reductase
MTDAEHDYDVIIAGAGPAGGQCARDLAGRGYDVVLLEAEPEDEFPRRSNKSTAGTFPGMLTSFGVPDRVIENTTDSVVIESPNTHYKHRQPGAVMDFAAFKRWLVGDARERGATLRFDTRVAGPIQEDGTVVGVRYDGDSELRAEIVVDATGPSAVLGRELGVSDLERDRQAVGIDYRIEGIDMDHPSFADLRDSMMLRLDHDIAPGGYSWIFHTGGDTAKVGLCYIQNERYREQAPDGMTIDDHLTEWLETDPRFEDATRIEGQTLRGSAHIQLPEHLSTDGFVAIGDTVPTIDPLWGEGIDKCMRSGRAAATAADHCLSLPTPDPSAETISLYDTLWHRDVAPNARTRLALTELLYRASNERYDRLVRDLSRSDRDTLAQANQGNPVAVARLLELGDVPMVAGWARERLERRMEAFDVPTPAATLLSRFGR